MKEQTEVVKMLRVLKQVETSASSPNLGENPQEAIGFCVARYNKVFDRLKEFDPSIEGIFEPLKENSTTVVISMACRQLIAWFDNESWCAPGWEQFRDIPFDTEKIQAFWKRGGRDLQGLGETIRDTIELWASHFPDARMRERTSPPQTDEDRSKTEGP